MKSILLLTALIAVFIFAACSRKPEIKYTWNEGFLERSYNVPPDALNGALSQLRFLPLRVANFTKEDGDIAYTVITFGVGDKDGHFRVGEIGGTFDMKKVTGEKSQIIGFKVGDGNRQASEELHERLAKILEEKTHQPP